MCCMNYSPYAFSLELAPRSRGAGWVTIFELPWWKAMVPLGMASAADVQLQVRNSINNSLVHQGLTNNVTISTLLGARDQADTSRDVSMGCVFSVSAAKAHDSRCGSIIPSSVPAAKALDSRSGLISHFAVSAAKALDSRHV